MDRKKILIFCVLLLVATLGTIGFVIHRLTYLYSFDPGGAGQTVQATPALRSGQELDTVTLTWDPVPGARSYNLYWSNDPGVSRRSGNRIEGVSPPYTFKGVRKGVTYYFVVTTVTDSGESDESNFAVYPDGK